MNSVSKENKKNYLKNNEFEKLICEIIKKFI